MQMTEITTYDEFKGLSKRDVAIGLGEQIFNLKVADGFISLGVPGKIVVNWAEEDYLAWFYSSAGEKAIKQAMAAKGYDYTEDFEFGRDEPYTVNFVAYLGNDKYRNFGRYKSRDCSEAVIHAAAKALLGGK